MEKEFSEIRSMLQTRIRTKALWNLIVQDWSLLSTTTNRVILGKLLAS